MTERANLSFSDFCEKKKALSWNLDTARTALRIPKQTWERSKSKWNMSSENQQDSILQSIHNTWCSFSDSSGKEEKKEICLWLSNAAWGYGVAEAARSHSNHMISSGSYRKGFTLWILIKKKFHQENEAACAELWTLNATWSALKAKK